ncbi:hypothetical protein LguiA_004635 [Lonicera macranthoides]
MFPRFHGKIFLPIAQRIEFYGKIGKVIEHLTKSLVFFFQPLIKMSSVFIIFQLFIERTLNTFLPLGAFLLSFRDQIRVRNYLVKVLCVTYVLGFDFWSWFCKCFLFDLCI